MSCWEEFCETRCEKNNKLLRSRDTVRGGINGGCNYDDGNKTPSQAKEDKPYLKAGNRDR